MSKATNAHKLQNALLALDGLSLWDTSLPVGALDITLSDDMHPENVIMIEFDHIIYTIEKHFKKLIAEHEQQALENWSDNVR
jgi:hypothetical protein